MSLFAALVDRYAKLILFLVFVLTIALIPGLSKVRIVSEPIDSSFTNPNELVRSVQEVKKSFGANTRVTIISVEAQGSRNVLEPPSLELLQKMTLALKTVPSIRRDSIVSLFTLKEVKKTADGVEALPLVEKIPRNFFEQQAVQKAIQKNDLVFGRLISKDLKTAMIVATAYDESDLFILHDELIQALSPYFEKDPNYKVTLVGDNEIYYQLQKNIQKDALLFAVIGLLMIIMTFYALFRTWKGVVLPFSATLIGVIWTMGLIGYYGEAISMLSATLPVVLVVCGSAYAIHVFHSLSEESHNVVSFRAALRRVLRRIFWPLLMSAATTFVGGITLLSFKLRMIQHFGVFTAIGATVTFIVSILVIPSFYKILRKPIQKLENKIEKSVVTGVTSARQIASATIQKIPVAGPVTGALAETVSYSLTGGIKGFIRGLKSVNLMKRFLKAVSKIVIEYPIPIIVSAVLLVAGALYQMRNLQMGFDNISMLPKGYAIKEVSRRLERAFNGIQSFDLVLDSGKPSGITDPKFLKQVEAFSKEVRENTHITYVFSIVDLIKKVDATLNDRKNEKGSIPETSDAIAQYLFLISTSGGTSLSSLATADYQKLKIRMTTNVSDTRETEKIYYFLKEKSEQKFGPEIKADFGGGLVTMVGVIRYVVWGKIQNIFSSLLTLLIIFALVYRSMVRSLITVVTLPVGVFSTFALMASLGIRLDIITAIITSFAMGFGVDFSIHFLAAVKEEYAKNKNLDQALERAILGPGEVILYDAISTIVGFSALFFSRFSSIHTFATLLCFNMFLLALGSITLVPAVVKTVSPEFITGHRKKLGLKERRLNFTMKLAFNCFVFVLLFFGIVYTEAKADQLSPDVLLQKSVQAVHTPNEESIYVMKLVGSSGDVSTRKMRVWFKSQGEKDAKLLIKFMEPADIRGTGFLTVAQKGRETDQWLYLPALKKSRRIKGGNMDEPFLGSDFTMGDMSVDKQDGLEYKVDGTKPCEGGECHVVVGNPRPGVDKASLTYSKKVYFIRKDNFLGVRGEFYNQAGQLEKVLTLQKMHQEGSRWVADSVEMKNLLSKHSTVLEIEKRDSSRVQPDHFFTVNFLERQ